MKIRDFPLRKLKPVSIQETKKKKDRKYVENDEIEEKILFCSTKSTEDTHGGDESTNSIENSPNQSKNGQQFERKKNNDINNKKISDSPSLDFLKVQTLILHLLKIQETKRMEKKFLSMIIIKN